jgi:HEAT repeat protein
MNGLRNLIRHRRAWRVLHVAFFCLAYCGVVIAQTAEQPPPEDDWFTAYFVDGYGFLVVFMIAFVTLLIFRMRRWVRAADPFLAKAPPRVQVIGQPPEVNSETRKVVSPSVAKEAEPKERRATPREPASANYAHQAFGAYRIDQEVGKLVLGKAHRMDVLASRVPEDRRAIEASLIKSLASADSDNEGRERARRALEDYGFVARQSALLLEGRDAWERSSAARVLGQIGSASSLAALIEGLHDGDSVVRNQAVTSLGQLKQPAAIGALLDVGRRYSDIPPSVLSESLSACSVEGLGFLDSAPFDLNDPTPGSSESTGGFAPLTTLEQLPTGDEDDALLGMLTRLESSDSAERAQVARELGMHRAERSVSALCDAAAHDADAAVRSAAVTALGAIDHESVFAPVLIALADDTREVRAAAARALSGLHFDRAQAYARLERTADAETLQNFAQACVKTGIAGQAADRLASEDRRQAHEAFSLFSLLTKAAELQPVFDVIENHRDLKAKQAAVRVLNSFATADAVPKLRDVVGMPQMPEDVRTGLLEVLYKLDNTPAVV